jgi:2-amino-4-hydroxy-6-hydroxymethyldihydropteridine diphosphokinase
MSNRAFVLLGSNIEKEKNVPAALRLLGELSRLIASSSIYQTPAVGAPGQPDFWNAAALLETEMDPFTFKTEVLAEVERRLGRVRTADRNAPRTIDADLILWNDEAFDLNGRHHIPDPDLLRFAHVAVPIAELAPQMRHPETGEAMADIAGRLRYLPSRVA